MLARGGCLILADFCRADGDLGPEQQHYLQGIDNAFKSAGNWHSAQQYKEMLGERGVSYCLGHCWVTAGRDWETARCTAGCWCCAVGSSSWHSARQYKAILGERRVQYCLRHYRVNE